MRTLLIASSLVFSLSAFTPSRDAEACGGNYQPELRVMRLSTHFLPHTNGTTHRRSFVVFGTANPGKLKWELLAPMSYDATQIAAGSVLAVPATFTIIGSAGTRVVTGNKHVYLSKSWSFDGVMSAVEVTTPDDGFSIAIEGAHAGATWSALEDTSSSKAKSKLWVKALGVSPIDADSIYVNRIAGTKFETVSVYPKDGTQMMTFVKYGDRNLGRYQGSPMGAFTNDGKLMLVLTEGALVTAVDLGPTYLGS